MRPDLTREKIRKFIESSSTLLEASQKLRMSYPSLQYYIKKFGVDHSHRNMIPFDLPKKDLEKIRKSTWEIRKRKKGLIKRWRP